MTTSTHIIEARGLKKQFGAVFAARDISAAIDTGTITGLIGTNGAGKTTFVNMLTGYLKPDAGQILFRGEDVTALPPREITRLGMARSFQIPQLFNTLTAQENLVVALGVVLRNKARGSESLNRHNLDEHADRILGQFGLQTFTHALAGTLPEGIRKLLDIAVAMVALPDVLLLDEPTSGVSSEEKFSVMDRVMAAAAERKVTMLFVEHDMEIIRRYSHRVLAFFDGAILADGEPAAVLDDAKVRQLIIGEEVPANRAGLGLPSELSSRA